jgi:glucuronide carrier protein
VAHARVNHPAAERRPGLREYVGYAAGEVANNLAFQTVSMFLLIYYTDVAGIAAAEAGTLFLVVRVWGGFTDLLAGRRVDRTTTRWGRFRPYLLFGPLPLLALLVATFSIPSGWSNEARVAWAFVSYALFSLAYSFVNIPYGSLAAAMTQDPHARARFATSRAIAASLTILAIAAVVAPQIQGAGDLQRSLTITTIAFALVGMALYLWCFATSREVARGEAATVGVRQAVAMVRHNRPLVLLCASALLFLAGLFSMSSVAVYYARDVLGDADLYVVMTLVQTVAMIAAAAVVPRTVAAIGKKRAYVLAGVLAVAGAIGFALAPASVPALAVAAYGIVGLGFGVINTLIFAFQADTVDYGEWRTGVRAEGGNYAALSFTRKAGQGIGGAAAAYTLGIGGYVSGAAAHGDAALAAIRVAAGIVPAVGVAGAALAMLAYPLTDDAFRTVVRELVARRGRDGDTPVPPAPTPATAA